MSSHADIAPSSKSKLQENQPPVPGTSSLMKRKFDDTNDPDECNPTPLGERSAAVNRLHNMKRASCEELEGRPIFRAKRTIQPGDESGSAVVVEDPVAPVTQKLGAFKFTSALQSQPPSATAEAPKQFNFKFNFAASLQKQSENG